MWDPENEGIFTQSLFGSIDGAYVILGSDRNGGACRL